MCIRFAQREPGEGCTSYVCEVSAAQDVATKKKQRAEIAVLVCRFDAGHFATPGPLVNVVKSPFVSAGCNYRHTAEAGAVLSIINSARALLFVLQISGLVRDLAQRDVDIATMRADVHKLNVSDSDRSRKAYARGLLAGRKVPPAKRALSDIDPQPAPDKE